MFREDKRNILCRCISKSYPGCAKEFFVDFTRSIGRRYSVHIVIKKQIAIISETYIRFYTYFLCAASLFVALCLRALKEKNVRSLELLNYLFFFDRFDYLFLMIASPARD